MQTGTSFLSGCSVVVLLFAALQWGEREREMITLLEPSRTGDCFGNDWHLYKVYSSCSYSGLTVVKVLVVVWFYKFGVPGRIHFDQGRSFESVLVQHLCKWYGVEKSRTTPYHSAGNGQYESFNRTLHNLLGTLPVSRKGIECLVFSKCSFRIIQHHIRPQASHLFF